MKLILTSATTKKVGRIKSSNPDVPEETGLRWALKHADEKLKKTEFELGQANAYIEELEDKQKALNREIEKLKALLANSNRMLENSMKHEKKTVVPSDLIKYGIIALDKFISKRPKAERTAFKKNYMSLKFAAQADWMTRLLQQQKAANFGLQKQIVDLQTRLKLTIETNQTTLRIVGDTDEPGGILEDGGESDS